MRISFMGGGSDLKIYYQRGYGSVISTAIDKYIYITVNKKFDDLIRVSYSKTEIVDRVEMLEHNIIREALKMTGIDRGVEIVYMGDIPLGSAGIGLGSSSSLAVGVLNALYAYQGKHVSAERLAREACRIEIDRLGHPMGKQDQYIAAYGGINFMRFNADESVFVDPVICHRRTKERLMQKLLLFYTGLERVSSEILAEQRDNIEANHGYIDSLVEMSLAVKEGLNRNEFDILGRMLDESWRLKRKLASKISNPILDDCYVRARRAGALGGKILGAGGGGFLLLYSDEIHHDDIREALADLKETPFRFEPQGSKIIYVSD
jgi:D-glycero-alpha-D-manno-heptose-7-phosphate kinase